MQKFFCLFLVFIWGCSSTSPKKDRRPAYFPAVDLLPANVGEGCQVALTYRGMFAPPTYEEMIELITFKPETNRVVAAYLKLPGDTDSLKFLGKLRSEDPRKFFDYPPAEEMQKDCAALKPLVAELTLMFDARIKKLSKAPRGGPDGLKFPKECRGKDDLIGCRNEVEA